MSPADDHRQRNRQTMRKSFSVSSGVVLKVVVVAALLFVCHVRPASSWTPTSRFGPSSVASSMSRNLNNNSIGLVSRGTKDATINSRGGHGMMPRRRRRTTTTGNGGANDDDDDDVGEVHETTNRRNFLGAWSSAAALSLLVPSNPSNAAATRAVGSGEIACREAGNCLEKGEWDGAVGWTWGGKDRCDASDPRCGPNGKLRDGDVIGKAVPPLPDDNTVITDVVIIRVDVGRQESGLLRLGLYGRDAPAAVDQFVNFVSEDGLYTMGDNSNALGKLTAPVTLQRGGVVGNIVPGSVVDFGVPSQTNAYARSRGTSKAGSSFVVQPRPDKSFSTSLFREPSARNHLAAGLLSVPSRGIGYGGTGFESDDEAYESSFSITNAPVSAFDDKKTGRKVIGQVLDGQSMAFLERLANLPTQRGIRGVLPGQNSGPPLVKVVVRDVAVSKVSAPTTST